MSTRSLFALLSPTASSSSLRNQTLNESLFSAQEDQRQEKVGKFLPRGSVLFEAWFYSTEAAPMSSRLRRQRRSDGQTKENKQTSKQASKQTEHSVLMLSLGSLLPAFPPACSPACACPLRSSPMKNANKFRLWRSKSSRNAIV